MKESAEAWSYCVARQRKIFDHIQNGRPLVGVCWAGQREMVFPIYRTSRKRYDAFLSISGYRAPDEIALPRIRRAAHLYPLINYSELLKAHRSLPTELPDIGHLERMLMPVCHMITLLLDFCDTLDHQELSSVSGSELLYKKIRFDINRRFPENLTLQSLSQSYHCSYSTISHIFRKYQNETFSQVLASTRVDAAKKYLLYTDTSISEIAHLVGFDDPNYFSSVFRQRTGLSPTQWKKENKTEPFGDTK